MTGRSKIAATPALMWLALGLAPIAGARAESTPRAHLIYLRELGAERCPEEAAMRDAVTARLGYDAFSTHAETTLTVVIRGTARGLAARIEMADALGDATGLRQLSSTHGECDDLGPALALAISIAIDPLSITRTNPIAPPRPTESAPPPEVKKTNAAVAAPRPPPAAAAVAALASERLSVRAGASVHLSVGTAPASLASGFTFYAGIRRLRWSLSLEARGDLPAGETLANGSQTSSWLAAAAVVPCLHTRFAAAPSFDLSGCALLVGGVTTIAGAKVVGASGSTAPLVDAGVRAAVEVGVVPSVSLVLHLDVLASFYWVDLYVGDRGNVVYTLGRPLSGDFGIGVWVKFR